MAVFFEEFVVLEELMLSGKLVDFDRSVVSQELVVFEKPVVCVKLVRLVETVMDPERRPLKVKERSEEIEGDLNLGTHNCNCPQAH